MIKDWTGNARSAFAHLASSHLSSTEREQHDFYATDPHALTMLLQKKILPEVIYECACGTGHLSLELEKHGHKVVFTDLIDRGFGVGGIDFLMVEEMPENCSCILTNPPYKYTSDFIEHSMELLPDGGEAIFLLNVNCLAGKDRFRRFYSKNMLKEVYLYSSRIKCAKNGHFEQVTGNAVNYAWFVFQKGHEGTTNLYWL